MDLKLNGRVVLVTGGSRGIGRTIAGQALAEGATVAICGRDDAVGAAARDALGGACSWHRSDVEQEEDVARLIAEVVERHGRIDAIVNNAGRFGGGPVAELLGGPLQEGVETKVSGALRVVRHALPHLRASDQARVVNISGVSAQRIIPGAAVTAIANAGLLTLTGYLARELAPDAVNVNCIVPGFTLTDVWRGRVQGIAEAEGIDFDAALALFLERQGMGHARWGDPREQADVVLFLLSAQASFVNGAAFRVDGGQFAAIQG